MLGFAVLAGLLFVTIIIIDGSEKRSCEFSFLTSEFACY